MSVTLDKKAAESGYTPCACRDCKDTTVSSDVTKRELCADCKDAGCLPCVARLSDCVADDRHDCQRDDAYEG